MNLKDLNKNTNVDIIEKKENESSNTFQNSKNVIKNLDIIEQNIESRLLTEELKNSTIAVIDSMNKFSVSVPVMLDKLNTITENLELEEFSKKLKIIEEGSAYILSQEIVFRKFIDNSNKIFNTLEARTENYINDICEKGFEIKSKEEKYLNFSKTLMISLFTLLIILFLFFIKYHFDLSKIEKSIAINNQMTSALHNVLIENEKYWIDKNNYKIYIESKAKKSPSK
ncbi:MAG: hypothetical protein SPH94_00715 [Fusobacterium necrophorum]|nr:hypothetical protein [Fusobacterium necrophorum]